MTNIGRRAGIQKNASGDPGAWLVLPERFVTWREEELLTCSEMAVTNLTCERWICRHGVPHLLVHATNKRLGHGGLLAWIRSQEQTEDFVDFLRGRLGYEAASALVTEVRHLAQGLPDKVGIGSDHNDEELDIPRGRGVQPFATWVGETAEA